MRLGARTAVLRGPGPEASRRGSGVGGWTLVSGGAGPAARAEGRGRVGGEAGGPSHAVQVRAKAHGAGAAAPRGGQACTRRAEGRHGRPLRGGGPGAGTAALPLLAEGSRAGPPSPSSTQGVEAGRGGAVRGGAGSPPSARGGHGRPPRGHPVGGLGAPRLLHASAFMPFGPLGLLKA